VTHIDDETLVTFLRDRALDAVPAPGLDPGAVLASSRRKRALIRGAQTAIALVVASVVVVGGVDLVGRWDQPAPPVEEAPTPTGPEPTGDAPIVGLAEGIRAVNMPVEMTLADGSAVLDVGMGDAWPSLGDRLALTTGPAEGANPAVDVDPVFEAAVPGAEVRLWTASAEGLRSRVTTLSWLPGDNTQDYPDGVYPAPTKVVESNTGQTLLIGAVPSWITDPTVTLHLATEVRFDDGTTGRSVTVPTFAAPTEDGRLLYLVAFDPTVGVSDGEGYAVTVADGAGETITAGCAEGDVEACIASVADPVGDLPEMCGVLGNLSSGVPVYEGWWSSSPAWPGGEDMTDPADWPPIVREHPQTAQIDTRTRTVLETVDRYACGPLVGYEVPADLELPPDAFVVVDVVTGEILETMRPLPLEQ
jgi:hypothetical protein